MNSYVLAFAYLNAYEAETNILLVNAFLCLGLASGNDILGKKHCHFPIVMKMLIHQSSSVVLCSARSERKRGSLNILDTLS